MLSEKEKKAALFYFGVEEESISDDELRDLIHEAVYDAKRDEAHELREMGATVQLEYLMGPDFDLNS
mgnify:CR=1 FL=1